MFNIELFLFPTMPDAVIKTCFVAGGCSLYGFALPSSAKREVCNPPQKSELPLNRHRVNIIRIYRTPQEIKY